MCAVVYGGVRDVCVCWDARWYITGENVAEECGADPWRKIGVLACVAGTRGAKWWVKSQSTWGLLPKKQNTVGARPLLKPRLWVCGEKLHA